MKRHLAVATLDFGTHGSGFGWAVLKDSNNDPAQRHVLTCTQWPGQVVAYHKTLTALLLDRDDTVLAWGHEARRRWRARQSGSRHTGHRYVRSFKMSLGHDANGDHSPRPAIALDDSEEAVERLIAAYLRKLYRFALTEIGKSGYREDDIRWCITVPAIWDDYQKQAMRRAAYEAGMPRGDGCLILALEPEAAAHHARISGVRTVDGDTGGPDLLRPGARFTVVDCGGGTVDITAYRNDEAGRMVEIGRVSGDKRGSQYLNEAFVECVLIKRLGGVEELQRLQRECPNALEDLLDRWEQAKQHVEVKQSDPLYLHLTAELARHLGRAGQKRLRDLQDKVSDQIVVNPDEVRDIFEQVVPRIITLVDEQLGEMRHHAGPAEGEELVLLVGGFAASPYLQQRLQNHLKGVARVLIPPDPAVAVLSGAVHFAYDPKTRARRSKYTYGTDVCCPFEEGTDPEEKRHVTSNGEVKCLDRFAIFVRAGDTIATGDEVAHTFYPIEGSQTQVRFTFLATVDRDPRYTDEPQCREIGEVTVDLEPVMHLGLDQRGIRLMMRFGETEIKTTAIVIASGKELDHTLIFHTR